MLLTIDVVIIGKNEMENLLHLRNSLEDIKEFISKTIYVDSNSNDKSIEIAQEIFTDVYKITDDNICSASLGRRIGTQKTSASWVLYLDGDMIFHKDFSKWLKENTELLRSNKYSGFVGNYIMNYTNEEGMVYKTNVIKRKEEYFGGASLLRREDVLNAGNWSDWLYSTEEKELLSRMKQKNMEIKVVDINMVEHFDREKTLLRSIVDIIIPINKKNYVGQAQALLISIKNLNKKYFEINKELYFTFFSICLLFIALMIVHNLAFFIANCVVGFILMYLINRRSFKKTIISIAFSIRIPLGLLLLVFNEKLRNNSSYEKVICIK